MECGLGRTTFVGSLPSTMGFLGGNGGGGGGVAGLGAGAFSFDTVF